MNQESQHHSDPNAGYKRAAKMLGIASGLGIEMAALVAGAAFLGEALQKRFELGTWVTLVCVSAAGLVFTWHVRYMLRVKVDPNKSSTHAHDDEV